MSTRMTKTLLAAAAAGATLASVGFAAIPAAMGATAQASRHYTYFTPTGGTPIGTNANCGATGPGSDCGMAGYQASGRDFRFAEAKIQVPDHVGNPATDPAIYVALDASNSTSYNYARAGVEPCSGGGCPASGWEGFIAVDEPTLSTPISVTYQIPTVDIGDGVVVSVYFNQTGNSDNFTVELPSGATYSRSVAVSGPLYTKALAVADYTSATSKPAPAPPAAKTRVTQFFQGRFTTLSGAAGTFNGPWTLNALEATSNGDLSPLGTLIGQPSYLWNDGSSYLGKGDDAFGVWLFPF